MAGRPCEEWYTRLSNLKSALQRLGWRERVIRSTSTPPRGLSSSNSKAFALVAGCAAGDANSLREALCLVAEERPQSGIEQLLVQIVGRHGLGHVYDVKDLVDFSLLPGVAGSEQEETKEEEEEEGKAVKEVKRRRARQ